MQCGKLFRRLGSRSERGISDPVPVRRLLADWSKLVKNDHAEQSDGGIERYAEPQAKRYGIFHFCPAYFHFEAPTGACA
jgi:hypothetical protein